MGCALVPCCWGQKVGIGLLKCIAVLAMVFTTAMGCVHQDEELPAPKEKPYFLFTVDWDEQKDLEGIPRLTLKCQPLENESLPYYWENIFVKRNIDGLDYISCIVIRPGETPRPLTREQMIAAVDNANTHILEISVRRFEKPTRYIDIRLVCVESCELLLREFEGGQLIDARTRRARKAPYWFSPGAYQLKAEVPES